MILRQQQAGQALVQGLLVMVLATLAAIWAASDWVAQIKRAAAQNHAHWMAAVARGFSDALVATQGDEQQWQSLLARLRASERHDVEPWLHWLQSQGWLSQAVQAHSHAPYRTRLHYVQSHGGCRVSPCPVQIVLVSEPLDAQAPSASDVLLALQGKGLAVSGLAPTKLQGATYQLPNPPTAGAVLPVGSVALMLWQHDQPPPYVRLHETRIVKLDGGLKLAQLPDLQAACSPEGLVQQGADHTLVICQAGRWQAVGQWLDRYASCLPAQPGHIIFDRVLQNPGLGWLVGGGTCKCPGGYQAVEFGSGLKRLGHLTLRDGYLCERL
jgi:hypothetical protein